MKQMPRTVWLIEDRIGDRLHVRNCWYYSKKEAELVISISNMRNRFQSKAVSYRREMKEGR